jgi:hypothetical protein
MPWRLERHEKDAVFKEVSVVFEDLEHRNRWNVDRSNIKEILNTVYRRITDEMEASRRTKTDDEDRSFMRKKMTNLVENLSHPPPSSNNGGGHKRPAEGNGGDDRGGGRQRADNGYANGSFGGASSHVVAVPPTIAMLADQDERERPAALKNLRAFSSALEPAAQAAIHKALQGFLSQDESALATDDLAVLASQADVAAEQVARDHGSAAATHFTVTLHKKLGDLAVILPHTGAVVAPPPPPPNQRLEGRRITVTTNFSSIVIKKDFSVCHCATAGPPMTPVRPCSALP